MNTFNILIFSHKNRSFMSLYSDLYCETMNLFMNYLWMQRMRRLDGPICLYIYNISVLVSSDNLRLSVPLILWPGSSSIFVGSYSGKWWLWITSEMDMCEVGAPVIPFLLMPCFFPPVVSLVISFWQYRGSYFWQRIDRTVISLIGTINDRHFRFFKKKDGTSLFLLSCAGHDYCNLSLSLQILIFKLFYPEKFSNAPQIITS